MTYWVIFPLKRALHEPIRTVDFRAGYELDSNKINTYKAFINDCLDANIKLYLVCSPHFINAIGADTSMVWPNKSPRKRISAL
jgi:hypothetical protein